MASKNKIFLIFGFWLLTFGFINSQNLIPNPSYEYTVSCPTGTSQLNSCMYWTNPTQASPDYFNVCSTANGGVASIPYNGFGFQNTRTGIAYAGFYTGGPSNGSNYREYVQTTLTSTLTAGKVYLVSFYVNLSNGARYATSKIGAYLSATAPTRSDGKVINAIPQIQNSAGFITDTLNWVKISGNYTALGDEQYITIGNFYNDTTTDTLYINHGIYGFSAGYYYIDDVSVIDVTVTEVGTEQFKNSIHVNIYPNPSNGNIFISATGIEDKVWNVEVADLSGRILLLDKYIAAQSLIKLNIQLSNGVYFIRVSTASGFNKLQKIIINH